MDNKSFVERARALAAKEDAERQKQNAAEEAAAQLRTYVASAGPAIAQQFAEDAINQVKAQVVDAGRLFELPAHSQRGAALEIVVRSKWLVTGNLSGSVFTVAVYDLSQPHTPNVQGGGTLARANYRIDSDGKGSWYWHHDGTSSAQSIPYGSPIIKDPSSMKSSELVDLILHKAISLAENGLDWNKPKGGFIVN